MSKIFIESTHRPAFLHHKKAQLDSLDSHAHAVATKDAGCNVPVACAEHTQKIRLVLMRKFATAALWTQSPRCTTVPEGASI